MGKINDFGFPFASVTGDRQYSASEWRDYFTSLLTNGVVVEILNALKINPQAVANKTVFVDTGAVVINGCMRILDTTQNVTIADNTSGNARIDRIVARLNYTDRKVEFAVLTGTPAGSPVAPTLTQNTTVWEISLAQIAVANGFSTIIVGNITDQRTYMQYNVEPYTSDNYFGKYSQMSGGGAKIGSAQNGVITFTTEDNDDFLAINIPTSASRIVIPSGATRVKFYCKARTNTENYSATSITISLRKNGTNVQTLYFDRGDYQANNGAEALYYSTPVSCVATDYFEIYVTMTTDTRSSSISAGSVFGIEILG